jgi:predicted O-methyltransferase YrrM
MEFTQKWFAESAADTWLRLFPQHFPDGIDRALEIGSYEGLSACYLLMIAHVKDLLCIDTWKGSDEAHFEQVDMDAVHDRFLRNVDEAVQVTGASCSAWQMTSVEAMKKLLADGEVFDFIYIDGSHMAADVFRDACLAFQLVRVGGWIYFDDYEWVDVTHPDDPRYTPKAGIELFCNTRASDIRATRSKWQAHIQRIR